MTDIPSTARSARESLSRGLSALQSDPTVPAGLLDIAGSIAQAMGALHQIERSNGATLSPHAETALTSTRAALSQLQLQASNHPAVQQAMEAVAGSLSMVHALSRLATGGGGAQPQAAQPQAAPPPQQPQAPVQQWQPQAQAQPPGAYGPPPQQQQQPAYGPPPQQQQPAYAPPPQQQQQFAPPPQQPAFPPPQQQQQAPRAAAADPFAPQRSPLAGTAVGAVGMPPAPTGPMHSKNPPAPAGGADMMLVEAELGAHSATNFYKGLSGNDIIDHGGLFVATYKIPKAGTPIRLKVALPGGYEFEANAIVKWRREASEGGDPGFGAQITGISPEARQLVYRYVRNREPLFHDDF